MMVDFKWIQISLFLVAELQFTAAAEQLRLSITVRVGDEVTLSCMNVMDGQQNCDGTTWICNDSPSTATVELIRLGQIGREAKPKSDRLSVTENCSLVIKNVTVQDVGRYTCRQFDKSGQEQGSGSQVYLSVVTMTEQKNTDEVTLNCSVSTYDQCRHTVKWLYNIRNADKPEVEKTSHSCQAFFKFLTSVFDYSSRFNLKCEVTDGNKVQQFPFSLRPSGEKPGEETTTTADDPSTGMNWLYITVAAVLFVALLIIVVKVIRWKRAKGNETQMNDNNGLTLNPAGTQSAPGTSQDSADPEDGVAYASISYTKKTSRKTPALGQDDDDDDDEAVTYATVKSSSSSSSAAAGASADPSNLYATVNEPKK